MQEPDPEVVRRAAAGDVAAFDVLVRTYQEPVWRFLRHLVTDSSLAEDLAQETFLRAFTRLDGFRFQCRFSTWLFQVARNLAIDHLRSRDRRRQLRLLLRPADPEPGPDVQHEVAEAVRSLAPRLREALVLIEVGGFTYREAGRILEVAEGTVKSRVFSARRALTAWFEPEEDVREV